MAEYATTELALPDALVLQERASTTTRENLLFTSELVTADERLGPDARGVAVTSNFHVLRTAELARRLGVDVRIAGAPVAWYYWPNAILREFVALLSYHRVGLAVGTLVVTLPLPILIALASTT